MAGYVRGNEECQDAVIRKINNRGYRGHSIDFSNALDMFTRGFYEYAINFLDKGLQFGSDDEIRMLVLRGLAKAFIEREDEAIEDFKKASSINHLEAFGYFVHELKRMKRFGYPPLEEIVSTYQKFEESVWEESVSNSASNESFLKKLIEEFLKEEPRIKRTSLAVVKYPYLRRQQMGDKEDLNQA